MEFPQSKLGSLFKEECSIIEINRKEMLRKIGESGDGKKEKEEENDLPKLSSFFLDLKLEEISEDLFALTGKMLSRKMKKLSFAGEIWELMQLANIKSLKTLGRYHEALSNEKLSWLMNLQNRSWRGYQSRLDKPSKTIMKAVILKSPPSGVLNRRMSSPGSSASKQLHNFQLPDSWQTAGRLRDRRRGAGPSSKPAENQEAQPPGPPKEKIGDKKEEQQEEKDLPKLPDFSLQLSFEEISEDIYALTGKLPPRNMKKNTKHVQKLIDLIFPGGSLATITADRYKVSKKSKKAQ